jgi:hypothetical protein
VRVFDEIVYTCEDTIALLLYRQVACVNQGARRVKCGRLCPWKTTTFLQLTPQFERKARFFLLCRRWDQFATNRELFGVHTTFDENFYTTPLEKSNDPLSRQREREAARIAREIEQSTSKNPHLAEVSVDSISLTYRSVKQLYIWMEIVWEIEQLAFKTPHPAAMSAWVS